MSAAAKYSERLGVITDEQFAAATQRLGLGSFVSAEAITSGLFGQNVFLTTSTGDFVLRGAPHWVKGPGETAYRREDRWQFAKEAYFVDQLHAHTKTPAPWPYLRDESDDIFGWPYAIMPRMPGLCFDQGTILKAAAPADRRAIASALGAMLAEMQTLTSPFAGDFDVNTISLAADPAGSTRRFVHEAQGFVAAAGAHGAITEADKVWIDAIAQRALGAPERPNTYVHCDYKLNNLTVLRDESGWRVSGLFDFHEARFGDGALDIVRQACAYLETDRDLAGVFVGSYLAAATVDASVQELMPLYVINDRLKIWEYFTRPETRADWARGKTFRDWAEPYLKKIVALL